jgi:hypothetical protein
MFRRIRFFIREKIFNIKVRCQRFMRGYAYSDVWDIDAWFMTNIKPMLIHLRDHGIGIPMDLYQEGVENERAAWEEVLTEMITCLDYMEEDFVLEKLGFYDGDGYKTMTKEDYEAVNNMMESNKNRFFELFSEHFYSLWD